jgi:transcription-repair coupling factor (superfamily II helicase)
MAALLQRKAAHPLIIVTRNNRDAEDMLPVVQALCELTGGVAPESVLILPTRDVLPFQNLSPHPDIQEARATALWKIASGEAQLVIAPVLSTAMRLRPAEYYADQARFVRRGEPLDVNKLVEHLNTVGYASVDVVEMPGEYAMRGGILDVYSAEADRPVRVEFFGDRPSPYASSIPARSALQHRSTRPYCCRSPTRRSQPKSWAQSTPV